MPRRWIIRTLTLALLTLCMVAWVESYFEYISVQYANNTHYWWTTLEYGTWELENESRDLLGSQRGWYGVHGHNAEMRAITNTKYEMAPYHFLGFAAGPQSGTGWSQYLLMIPLWFPTTLSAALLCLLWHNTRPKPTKP